MVDRLVSCYAAASVRRRTPQSLAPPDPPAAAAAGLPARPGLARLQALGGDRDQELRLCPPKRRDPGGLRVAAARGREGGADASVCEARFVEGLHDARSRRSSTRRARPTIATDRDGAGAAPGTSSRGSAATRPHSPVTWRGSAAAWRSRGARLLRGERPPGAGGPRRRLARTRRLTARRLPSTRPTSAAGRG